MGLPEVPSFIAVVCRRLLVASTWAFRIGALVLEHYASLSTSAANMNKLGAINALITAAKIPGEAAGSSRAELTILLDAEGNSLWHSSGAA